MAEANRIKNRRLQGHGARTEEFEVSDPLGEASKQKEPLSAKEEKQMLRDLVHVKTEDV